MSQPVTKKFKLRRIKPVEQDLIEENLKPLKQNIQKKIRAQEAYYENHNGVGVSPLIRDFKRRPVHQRLGRRVPFNGTNTSAIPPKRRLRLSGFNNNQPFVRRTRVFTAQQRLNRIRANQREVLNSHNVNTSKKIKLRRTLPQRIGGPANLQVQVKNNTYMYRQNVNQNYQRFRQILRPHLQLEIKKIMLEHHVTPIIGPIEVTATATLIPLHKRFGELS